MSPQTLHDEIKGIIKELLEIDDFGDRDHFIRDLRADSMLLEELVAVVEKKYKVSLPTEELRSVRCLEDMVRLVGGRIKING